MKLRYAEQKDIDDLFKWRNHPAIRKYSFNTRPLCWYEHETWFKAKLGDANTTIYIACHKGKKIGSVRFEEKDEVIKINVMLSPDFLGKGFGSNVIRMGTEEFIRQRKPRKPIVAEIKKTNVISVKAFKKAGFRESYLTFMYKK